MEHQKCLKPPTSCCLYLQRSSVQSPLAVPFDPGWSTGFPVKMDGCGDHPQVKLLQNPDTPTRWCPRYSNNYDL